MKITTEVVANFQGKLPRSKPTQHQRQKDVSRTVNKFRCSFQIHETTRWPSKDIPILTIERQMKKAKDTEKRAQLERQVVQMKMKRSYHDIHTRTLVHKFLQDKTEAERQQVLSEKAGKVYDLSCHHEGFTTLNTCIVRRFSCNRLS